MKKLFSVNNKKFSIRGFTLVEVIVVIGVIALLTTIIYASLNNARAQSRDQKRVADISNIQLALELYFNMKKQYPMKLWPENGDPAEFSGKYLSDYPTIFPQKLTPPTNYSWDGYFYVPITLGGTKCTSYHLWTLLEAKSSALASKRGYNSADVTACNNTAYSYPKVNASASTSALIYDVTP